MSKLGNISVRGKQKKVKEEKKKRNYKVKKKNEGNKSNDDTVSLYHSGVVIVNSMSCSISEVL